MKITKAKASKFNKVITKFVKEMNGTLKSTVPMDEYMVSTSVGPMMVSIPNEQNYTYTIFCRFMDVAKAKMKFDCNPYSGKYNFHHSRGDIDEIISMAINHIEITQ